jgi:hypothetical protein
MKLRSLIPATILVAAGATLIAAQQPSGQPEMQLPEDWTPEDMQACMAAGTPGEQHAHLAAGAGVWRGTFTLWMAEGAEPMESESTTTVTPIMDGRYVRMTMEGEMPGMGQHNAEGVFGYDNVSGQYVSNWIDNFSTGIMSGVGEPSQDGKTITWTYTYNCPVTSKPATIREIDTITGPNSRTLTIYGANPKTGKEYKMGFIELERVKGLPGDAG